MILTEEEARTKWCPEARVAIDAQGYSAANRFGDDGKSYLGSQTFCIGSACMAWRWEGDWSDQKIHPNTLEAWAKYGWVKVDDPFEGDDGTITVRYAGRRVGFCGKAGKP